MLHWCTVYLHWQSVSDDTMYISVRFLEARAVELDKIKAPTYLETPAARRRAVLNHHGDPSPLAPPRSLLCFSG